MLKLPPKHLVIWWLKMTFYSRLNNTGKNYTPNFIVMDKIKTPTLIVKESICRKNIKTMAEKCRKSNVVFRPHFKTHQSLKVGQWFRDEGISKIAVSSFSMAQFFADNGWNDIMIAFPFNPREIDVLNRLSEKTNISILLAGNETLPLLTRELKNTIDFYVKIDVGSKRTGYQTDSVIQIEKMLDLADMNNKLNFKGFVAHAGHLYNTKSISQIKRKYAKHVKDLQILKNYFTRSYTGIIISWGDTPSCSVIEKFEGVDEIRPGNFVYYDLMQLKAGICKPGDIAITMAAPVVAKYADRHEVVIYGGAIHLSKDYVITDKKPAWGMVVYYIKDGWQFPKQPAYVRRIYQEHGIISMKPDDFFSLNVGDLAAIIPVHSCLTVSNLKNNYHFI